MAKATAIKIRTGKKHRGAVYVLTKSGRVYRFKTVFTTPGATRTFIGKVKAARGQIDTRHWTKVA